MVLEAPVQAGFSICLIVPRPQQDCPSAGILSIIVALPRLFWKQYVSIQGLEKDEGQARRKAAAELMSQV